MIEQWSAPPSKLEKPRTDVYLWQVPLDVVDFALEQSLKLLPQEERERAERFKFLRDCRRYVVSHVALRQVLSTLVGAAPASLEFTTNATGKPFLAGKHANAALAFNLSHSHESAMIAVTGYGELGVDIEYVQREFEFHDLAKRFFTESEFTAIEALPVELQRPAFFRCWTAKEAFLKAKGTGLSGKLDEVQIHLDAGGSVAITAAVPEWSLVELPMAGEYVATLVTEGPRRSCRFFNWQAESIHFLQGR